jgi:gliding motility-associated-like protein
MASQAQQTITLKADSIAVPCHDVDTFLIPIRVFDFNSVAGLQFTFEWNPAFLDYAYITNVNPAFSGIGFDTTTFQAQGKFTFSWTAIGGLTLPDSAVLLQVAFTRLGGPASLVGFSNSPTAIAAIDPLGNDLTVVTAPGLVSPIDTEAPTVVCPGNVTQEVFGPSPVNSIAPASILDNCSIQSIGWSTVGATTGNSPNDPDASGATFNLGQSSVTYLVTDVGGNTASCSFQINLTLAPSDSLTLIASNGAGTCGETVTINISVLNYDSIGGIQFSVGWDPAVLSFDTIANANPSLVLDATNFGTQQTANGFISFAWTSALPFGLTLVDGSVLFSLTFNVVATGNNSSNIAFGNFPTDMLAISSATNPSQEIGFLIVNGSVVITDTMPPAIQCPANVSVATPPGVITATFNNLDPVSLMDNCSANVGLAYQQSGATTGSGLGSANGTYNAGTTVVTYTATDGSGNTSTCSFSVLVDAGTPLTLILDTVSVDCQDTTFAISLTVRDFVNIIGLQFDIQWDSSIIKFDSVGNLYPGLGLNPTTFFGFTSALTGNTLKFFGGNAGGWPAVPDNDTLFTIHFGIENLGTSNINFTGIISAVNSAFNVVPVVLVNGVFSVADFTPPNLVCPMDVVIPADSAACIATYLLAPAQATDVCSGIMSVVSNKTDSIYATGPTVVTFTATDDAGNSATCSMTVTVQGDALPQLTNCPPNVTVGVTTAVCSAAVSWNLPQAFNPCDGMNLNVEASDTSGTVFPLGDSVVTFLAFNISGDTVMCSFTVSVRDSLPPSVSCPSDYTVQADSAACSTFLDFDLPIGADNCDQNITLVGSAQPGDEFFVGVTPVTFTGTDASGNADSCTFMVTVFDLSPPVFDNCPGDTTVYAAVDSCGVSVFWNDITVTDDCSGTLSVDPPNYSGEFFSIGISQVNYFATDAGGNIQSCAFAVTVLDTLAPVLNCPMDLIVFLPADKCDTLVTWAEPMPTDGCGIDDLVPSHDNMTTVFPTGVHVVTYTAYDPSSNTAECTFTIEVKDVVDPVLAACPADTVVVDANPCGVNLIWALPDATDNCQLDTVYSIPASGTLLSNNVTTVVVYALDASGNDDTCSFTITLQFPNIPPGFDSFPADLTLNGCAQPVSWTIPVPNAFFCSMPTIEVIPSTAMPGDTFPVGVTQIIYVALDSITGLEVVRDTFTVTVVDNAPPVLSGCPTAPVIVHIGGLIVSDSSGFVTALDTIADCSGVEVTFNLPTATDSCGGALVAQTTGPLSGMVFPGDSVSTLVFVATDDNGNTSECSVNVAVVGLQPLVPTVDPLVACPGDEVILMVDQFPGASYTWTGPNQTYPDNSQITVIASAQNAGTYTVSATINGCSTPPGSVDVTLASVGALADTILITMGGGVDTFSVVANDLVFPIDEYVVTPLTNPLPDGLVYLGNGIFTFEAPESFRPLSFFYELCSAVCPDVCDTVALVTIRLDVNDCSFIPNVMTPNGDGVNDYFRIPCIDSGQFRDNSIVIYNQWGDKVFDAAPYDNLWTGTLNNEAGKDLPDGVYYYIFKSSPGEPARKGFVQIHR